MIIHVIDVGGGRERGRRPVKNVERWLRREEGGARQAVEWGGVKGQAGHPPDERADALARVGIPGSGMSQ
mgnify:CR=1 FL=1